MNRGLSIAFEKSLESVREAIEKIAQGFQKLCESVNKIISELTKPDCIVNYYLSDRVSDRRARYVNKRVAHLALHAKKKRTRNKNMKRIIKSIERYGK